MIKLSSTRGKIEYKKPVNLDDPQCENVKVHLTMYESQSEAKHKYCPGDTRVFRAYFVIIGIQEDYVYIIADW